MEYAVEIRITLGSDRDEADRRAEHLNDLLEKNLNDGEEIVHAETYTY